MKAVRYGLLSFTFAILLSASFVGGARYGNEVFDWLGVPIGVQTRIVTTSSTEPASVAPTFSLFWEAWNVVTHNYVDQPALDVKKLTYGAIRGMVSAIGDTGHSRFLSPTDYRQEQGSLRGSFIGIGAEVGLRNGQPIIITPLEGGPAQKAGLRAGDAIVRVDGADVSHATLTELMAKLRGDAGSSVTISVLHQGSEKPVDLKVTRGRVTVQPVTYYVLPDSNVADIRLSEFSNSATSDLKAALKTVMNRHVAGIVLDLRDNPGGILNQAVDVASQFLDQGTVVIVKDANGQQKKLAVKSGGLATNVPLTVLINNGTASAAEIVAGALEDNHRATVVGQTTFGTGTVLSTFRLKDGSAILLGTSEWLTPSGQLIKGKGIQPTIGVRLASQSDVLTPTREKQLSPAQIQQSGDSQLLSAVKYLAEHPEVKTGSTG